MKQYLNLIKNILENGVTKKDRTGTGTISMFATQSRYNLKEGFPLLTTKKVHFKSILGELLWFLSGDTNIQPLCKQKIRIWNEWPYVKYAKSKDYKSETMDEFIEKICNDDEFAKKHGDLGPVYGYQWRNFGGVDQVKLIEKELRENKFSRRLIISAWDPVDIDKMLLPPCHAFMQFYVSGDGKTLSLQLYQRSADVFLGVPFNIASYALLLKIFAFTLGYEEGEFIHTTGDTHIYLDHLDQVHTQLERTPKKLPQLIIKTKRESVVDYKYEDFELVDYDPYPLIKGKVSV